jgi:hypothetical protein
MREFGTKLEGAEGLKKGEKGPREEITHVRCV